MASNPSFSLEEEHKYEVIRHNPQGHSDDKAVPRSHTRVVLCMVVLCVIIFVIGFGAGFGSAFARPSAEKLTIDCHCMTAVVGDDVTTAGTQATTTACSTLAEFEALAEGVPIHETILSTNTVTTGGQCSALCRQEARCDGFSLDQSPPGARSCTLYDKERMNATYLRHQPGTSYFAKTDDARQVFLYYPILKLLNWDAANENCPRVDPRARLVDVQNAEESRTMFFLKAVFPATRCTWAGHLNVFTSGALVNGVWTWMSTGQPVHFTAWGRAQPDNWRGNEFRIDFLYARRGDTPDSFWNDRMASATQCSICKVTL